MKYRKIKPRPNGDVAIFDLLYDAISTIMAHKSGEPNHSKCAALMGVSRLTWIRWNQKPPKQWFYNYALYKILKDHSLSLFQQRETLGSGDLNLTYLKTGGRATRDTRGLIDAVMKQLPAEFKDKAPENADDHLNAASMWLIKRILRSETDSVTATEVKHSGHNYRTMLRAAHRLGIEMKQSGFGKDKESHWRLPPQWGADED